MFQLDTNAAKSVTGAGNYINESGLYDGVITRAEWSDSPSSQAKFLNLDFKSDEGQEANYMSICYQKGDGTKSFGYNTMMAIMACCKVRSVTSQNVNGKNVCPELTGAHVTLGLQAEADWYQDKDTSEYKPTTNMHIYLPFTKDTKQTAKELLDNLSGDTYGRVLIKDKKAKDKPSAGASSQQQSGWGQPQQQQAPQQQYNGAPMDFDDDIPF